MVDLLDLPKSFEELAKLPLQDFSLSDRIIDPIIIIDKVDKQNVARLAGVRISRGKRYVHYGPSNNHNWVVDGTIIHPLPRDSVILFDEMLSDSVKDDLSYSEVIRLVQLTSGPIKIEPKAEFFKTGKCKNKIN